MIGWRSIGLGLDILAFMRGLMLRGWFLIRAQREGWIVKALLIGSVRCDDI